MTHLSASDLDAIATPLPVLPLRNGVLFPGVVLTLPIGRARSVALVQALAPGDILAVAVQREPGIQDPELSDMHPVATLARVHQVARHTRQTWRLTLEGVSRVNLDELTQDEPFWRALVHPAPETRGGLDTTKILADTLRRELDALLRASGGSLTSNLKESDSPSLVADKIASSMGLDTRDEVELLNTLDVDDRLRRIAQIVGQQRALRDVKREIEAEVKKSLNQSQREAILREQLRAINKELGDDPAQEGDELRAKLEALDLPEEVQKVVDRELRRFGSLRPNQPEYNVIRTYLELIADLPWDARADASLDIDPIAEKLDADHFGLNEVKERILEHMAVMRLSGNPRGTILCLAGPPGVGKTSLGQSIADATGRPLVRIALGGIRDEAEVRGHRRTYIGALPGRIIHAMRKAEVKNPLILLDEIDKLGQGWMGSPEAALLEVLDPEQNNAFTDNYLELPFDLSEVFFICTANNLQKVSGPLRDRLEIIEVPGYTVEEKAQIAKRHLIPKQLTEHGVPEDTLTLDDAALTSLIQKYTREAGVRRLKQQLTKLCRALALRIARNPDSKIEPVHVTPDNLSEYLGKPRFFNAVAERTSTPGVATGLAWTPVGGDILFIETTRMNGKGRLQITGQLGDVMKESAQAALAYVRSNAEDLGIPTDFLDEQDLHIHVPAGAVPKDGPSAGVTIFTALTSLFTGRRVRADTAMTGECTLRGRVLPVGGIKAKVLAAQRAGLTRVILPHLNQRDLDDVPEEARKTMEFIFAEDMSQVLAAALEEVPAETQTGPLTADLDASAEPTQGPSA